MKRFAWEIPLVAILCTGVGLAVGKLVLGGAEHAAADEHADEHTDEHADEHGPHLSEATLTNLGVEVAPIELTRFVRRIRVAATVVDTPRTELPVFAPMGGRVDRIDVVEGMVTGPGQPLASLVREALPRPELTLTAEVLRPAQERLHETVLELRRAAEEVRIAGTELERVERYTESVTGDALPILPRERAIELRYQLARAEMLYEQARYELVKHGLSAEQIDELRAGGHIPVFDEKTWQRALARNGLWSEDAQRLNDALPAALQKLPWVTATIGELSARGLVGDELVEWMADDDASRHFLDIGVLLERGHTVQDLKRLSALNALEPIVEVVAPPLEGGRWDVREVLVKSGEHVPAGSRLMTLADPRRLYLRSEPVGAEIGAVLAAAASGADITARPLIAESGPVLEGLGVAFIASATASDGTVAYVDVDNAVLAEVDREDGRDARTWALRRGLRYVLEVPVSDMEGVYVLPSSALTTDGPDKVVFLEDGESFKTIPVAVAYQDERVVVIRPGKGVALFPGDRIVQAGAFELGLALHAGSGEVDAHAGHSH